MAASAAGPAPAAWWGLAAGYGLVIAAAGWWALPGAGTPAERTAQALPAVLTAMMLGAWLAGPWLAAGVAPGPLRTVGAGMGRRLGGLAAASAVGAVAALLPAGGPPVGMLAAALLLCLAFAAGLGAVVAAARAAGVGATPAQGFALVLGAACCASPAWATPVVACPPHGAWRDLALVFVTGANPLLVAGESLLGWDVWRLPYLYRVADVASYGTPRVTWWGAALGYAVVALAGAGFAAALARRRATT